MFVIDTERVRSDAAMRLGIRVTPERSQGMGSLLTNLGQDPGFTMIRELAYVMATIQWETAGTFQPIQERRASRDRNPRLWDLQYRYWPSGYYGRGYIQITWRDNYLNAGKKLAGQTFEMDGVPVTIGAETFIDNPDWVMQPDVAYLICARGMREGWFTGRKLGNYIRDGEAPDYVNARRVVNGLDKAQQIADIANEYELLLRASATPIPRITPQLAGIPVIEPIVT